MSKIIVTTQKGKTREVKGASGSSLMEILRDADMGVAAICGGVCSCATCHVYINGEWEKKLPPRSEEETDLLKELESYDPSASRLSCQIEFTEELDGLTLTVAPEE
ncbi:MAG: ferredoxin [Proteobacteria bacterium]|jgi:2Fe-2S ferredoxin|nr:MAG: ferredoxin [Pseudomonadota bacterium]